MIPQKVFIAILVGHFIADFFLQTHWMAKNKSSSNAALTVHIMVYTTALAACMWTVYYLGVALTFALVNGACHWITDYGTSRWTKHLWQKAEKAKQEGRQ